MLIVRSRQISAGGRDSSTRYYDPKSYVLDNNGQLTIKAYGGEAGEARWRGFLILSLWQPDYKFWCWMVSIQQVFKILEERELDDWKRQYAENGQMT